MRILVVDDEELIRDVLEMALGDEGYAVTTASNGREALARIVADPPDLVISDMMMPHMDGLELMIRARELLPALPVVLISAVHPWKQPRELPAHTTFLAKPFDLETLLTLIIRLTGRA